MSGEKEWLEQHALRVRVRVRVRVEVRVTGPCARLWG